MTGKPLKRPSEALRDLEILERAHPDAEIALNFTTPFQLLVATILSAQCTDVRVNQVTPELFRRFPDPAALAGADPGDVEELIRSTGFFRNKAANLIACAGMIRDRHGEEVPITMEELVELPGVGRKTANVVLGNAFGTPGMVVDTHVKRVARRLGWTLEKDPEKVERDLCALLPRERWTQTAHLLIYHGRRICRAPVPTCSGCPLVEFCPRTGVNRSK